MTGHIPQSFIENLLARADIVEIIGGRITLRRAGTNFVTRCPFHVEKTPSFTVNPTKQFYHCFGCGASGDVIRFLTDHDGLHFVEAIEMLANRLGLSIPAELNLGSEVKFTHLYDILSEAAEFYQIQLRKHPNSEIAKHYLKSRGLTGQIAKQFLLGFAPPNWDSLVNHLGTTQERLEDLVKAGLAICKEKDRYFDRFRNRVVFPIRDRRGRVIGFGGRIIGKEGEPKYLNSPITPVFNKGAELYGLYEARLGNRALPSLLVVEGYLDVVSLAQFGIKNAVATMGTALTVQHIEALFKQTSELVFCFDGDKAGKEADKRALPLILPHMKEGRRVKFVLFEEGEDPDSCIRKEGLQAFSNRLQRAIPLSDFLFDTLSVNIDLNHLDGRAQLITQVKPLIKLLPGGVYQQMMFDRLSELSGVGSWLVRDKQKSQKTDHMPSYLKKSPLLPPSSALRAVAIVLKRRDLISLVGKIEEFHDADLPGVSLLCAIIDILSKEPGISLEAIGERLPPKCIHEFPIEQLKTIVDAIPEVGIEQEFLGALQRLRARAEEQAMESLLTKAKIKTLSLEEKTQLKNLLDLKDKDRVD